MKVSIDPSAGFCFGVKRAIEIAEGELKHNKILHCLGEIVHNETETKRLENCGLVTISNLNQAVTDKILFRAHGEPPSTYKAAAAKKTEIIDATCPVVLNFQQKIKKTWNEIRSKDGQVVIYGNISHPEVIGLVGQVENEAIVIEGIEDLKKIDFHRPVRLFVQTTKKPQEYNKIIMVIQEQLIKSKPGKPDFKFYHTICRHVSQRIPKLIKFCQEHEIIVFVSDKNSSNGMQLYSICKKENNRSYLVSRENEIRQSWFASGGSVGISGATSTPRWLLERIANQISSY